MKKEYEERLNRCRECTAQRKGPCEHSEEKDPDGYTFGEVLGGRP